MVPVLEKIVESKIGQTPLTELEKIYLKHSNK
jgi:hypothetical protein